MEKKTEPIRIVKKENWKYFFKMKQYDKNKSYVYTYYVNPEMNKIRKYGGRIETIITCPIELDFILCSYLCKDVSNVLITWKLIDIINNMFHNCGNNCRYWNEYDQMLNDIREMYIRKGIIPQSQFLPARIIDMHFHISKLYMTTNGSR